MEMGVAVLNETALGEPIGKTAGVIEPMYAAKSFSCVALNDDAVNEDIPLEAVAVPITNPASAPF